jgi:hypothetical protein
MQALRLIVVDGIPPLSGTDRSQNFRHFVKSMLRIAPSKRASSTELLEVRNWSENELMVSLESVFTHQGTQVRNTRNRSPC